ncbi:MAG: hypothetical protein R6V02_05680 [Candidatus Aminicenantes bacterium]
MPIPTHIRRTLAVRLSDQAVEFFQVESCPTQAVLPLVGLAAGKVVRQRYKQGALWTIGGNPFVFRFRSANG